MTLWTSLEPSALTLDPGGHATARLRLRNTGDTVEEYRLSLVGAPAGWSRVEPDVLRLYPGTEGTAEISFAPPRTSDAAAGPAPYGIRVEPRERPDLRTVVEGQATVTSFTEIRAELLPSNMIGRFRGRARVAVDNLGNTPLTASLTARDESNSLTFDLDQNSVQVAPGRAAFAGLTVRPQQVRWTGTEQQHQLTLSVRRSGDERAHDLSGSFDQRPVLPPWLVVAGGLLVTACVAFVAIWLAFAPKFGSSAGETRAAPAPRPVPQGKDSPLALPPAPDSGEEKDAGGPPPPDAEDDFDLGPDPGDGGGGDGPPAGVGDGGGDGGGDGPSTPERRPASGGGDKPPAQDNPSTPDRGSVPDRRPVPPPPAPKPPPPAKPAAPVGPPFKKGYQSDDMVLFAQYRMATFGSKNACTLGQGWTAGVIDDLTDRSLRCYQQAVMNNTKTTRALTRTDPYGTLSRATMTSLWAQAISPSEVSPGSKNFAVTKLRSSLWWATQASLSDGDVNRLRGYSRLGVEYYKSGGRNGEPTTYNATMEQLVSHYQNQVGLPVTGVANWATIYSLVGGTVNGTGRHGR
ncbi:COG1470 family protein [Streptomyces yaizuensis]|uniref:Hydrolase n=1 Tax=Streptomyces yaizuensis TaxID=2989713 RepID=A0ABQ5P2J1_9ACTN|nr:hydrolase [Streptomyces sp. YSPA8]GLF96823.1 hydrolase [Streptomyces sp. YSPA8]